jgi:hypothetical protein
VLRDSFGLAENSPAARSLPLAAPAPAVRLPIPSVKMDVDIAAVKHTFEEQGTTYISCCPGCRARFAMLESTGAT